MLNKRGLSPLIATLLLVVFALVVGTATIIYDDSRTGREAIVNAVNSVGYKVTA